MKRKSRRLKELSAEALALLEYLIAESYESGKEMHYRLRLPYGPDKVEYVIDFSVYFDGELIKEQPNEPNRVFKITGPDKGRH